MNCWLVVNTFMDNEKFKNLYELLSVSFKKHGVSLTIKRAKDISLEVGKEIKNKPDFAIFWDKDIYLAERLESQGIKLFNSSRAINLCDNKILMYQELIKHQIRVPRTFVAPKTFEGLGYKDLGFIEEIAKKIGWPIVIKEAYGSFGEQVYLAHNMNEAKEIIKHIGYHDFLIQEFIASSKGKDIRINVVNDHAIVSMLRENKDDFRSNISSGGKGVKFTPEKEYLALAVKAAKALGLDFAGVDVMFGEDGPIICEVNSNPQFASTLKATGVNLADYIADYILRQVC